MATSTGYISLSEFKAYKGTTSTGADTLIGHVIEAASRFIDNRAFRRFYPTTGQTLYYTPRDSKILFIDDMTAVTTLKTDEDGDGTFENTLTENTDFWLMPFQQVAAGTAMPYEWIEINPNGDYTFPVRQRGVQIVGDIGWASVPANIKIACYEIVDNIYQRRSGQNTEGVATITAAGVVITPSSVPKSALDMIDAYRKRI